MLTVEEIVSLAAVAASGGRKVVFQSLAREVGVVGRPGGWIYLPGGTKPVAHGWQAFAQLLSGPRVGFTGRDLLVEMSKASVSPADLAAAERGAHAMNVTPASAVRGHDQRRDFYREVSRRIVGPHSAQAERYAKRRLIAELHDEALDEDARRADDELPDCECHTMRAPHGGHMIACRRGEAIRRRGVVTVDDEFAEAHMDALREARAEPALVTLTAIDIEAVADRLLDELGKLGLSTPVRVGTIPLARCLGRALATVHIAVEQ